METDESTVGKEGKAESVGKCSCGAEIPGDAKFCSVCGKRVESGEAQSSAATGTIAAANQDSRNMALLVWILTIFFGFIPGLIFYLVKTDDPYLQDQSKEALNWSITTIIGYIIGGILMLVLIGVLVFVIVGICNVIFCIMGAAAASNGKPFRVPFAVRLLK
jgi:uncharacterized protein